jgi:Mg-chelatase subunit ChlD
MLIAQLHILAAPFVTPAFFVAGILLASIPIIIHILNRRRYKTVNWAAMEFLLRAMRKNRRRLKFEQWILLATRCLLVFLVATALARPIGCKDTTLASLAGQRSGLHVIVIDNSHSMAYEAGRPNAATHLDRAKQLAKELIETLAAGGESVAIVVASRPASAVLAAPTYDIAAARDAVDRVQQAFGDTDLLGALRLASEIGQKEKNPGEKRLYVISDGTRSAWERKSEGDAIRQLAPQLAQLFRISHFNLGRRDQWNQAVLEIRPSGNLVTNKLENDLLATLHAFGTGPDPLLQWRLDDTTLPGGGQVRINTGGPVIQPQTAAVFKSGGPHVVTATLTGEDRLRHDNTRHRVLDVVSEMKVLIVEGERGMNRLNSSGAFLDLALAPPKDGPTEGGGGGGGGARSDSHVAPELISDLELGNKVLGDYRAVILAGVGQISAPQADQLALFVKNGGALMIFMGEPVAAENYNTVLLPRGLMPGALTKRVSTENGFNFDFNPNDVHYLLKEFENNPRSGLDTAQVYTYWQMELKADGKVERVLNYVAGTASGGATTAPSTVPAPAPAPAANAPQQQQQRDPAITFHQLGQGHIVCVTTTADPNPEWTTLPAKPNYVTLVHELLSGSVSTGDRWMNVTAGEPLVVPTGIKFTGTPTLTDPSQREIVLEPLSPGGAAAYRSPPLVRPGVYRLSTGAATMPIAVNIAADEADVRTLDDGAIRKALGDVEVELHGDTLPPAIAAAADTSGNDFGWPFMLIGAMLVAAECFMAMRFGHYRRT